MTAIKRVATVSGVFFIESMSKTSGEVSEFHELIKLASSIHYQSGGRTPRGSEPNSLPRGSDHSNLANHRLLPHDE
jgi:hypothetical protein